MKLHEAIVKVIKKYGRPMRATEIAYALNHEMILYRKRNGSEIKSNQISARINKHSSLFTKDGPLIGLSHSSLAGARPRNKTGVKTNPEYLQKPMEVANPSLADKELLNIENFRLANDLDKKIVPDQSGIYAIRIRNIDALPDTFSEALNKRRHNLIYIGIASKSLQTRMLDNELRGREHGTFFRSLGATLGYLPPKGSLKGKSKQYNYTFSEEDKRKIITWINKNLLVNWVCMDDGLEKLETGLIVSRKPLINIQKNPCKLPELTELRNKCRLLASS